MGAFGPRSSAPQEAEAYAEENGLLYMETSAKTALNVNEIFVAIGALCATAAAFRAHRAAAKKLPKGDARGGQGAAPAAGLDLNKEPEKAAGGCC